MTAICGPKCSELFGLFDPVGSWARTFTGLLVGRTGWYSNRCALTWKRKVTKSNRMYFQLAVSALHTKGTGHGLLPTAQTQGLKMCENGKTKFYPVGLLPTPRTKDVGRGSVKDAKYENGVFFRENKQGVRWGVQLPDLIASGLLPTPNASEAAKYAKTYNPDSQMGRGLTALAVSGMIPTPKAGGYQSPGRHGTGGQDLRTTIASQTGETSQLNPLFVEEMMGFPTGWILTPFLKESQHPGEPKPTTDGGSMPSKPTETP